MDREESESGIWFLCESVKNLVTTHLSGANTLIVKVFISLILLLTIPTVTAEGIASMTTVTASNGKDLQHHGLAVICKSQNGKTFVDMIFRANPKTPFSGCSVTVYDLDGKKVLLQIDPEIRAASRLKGLPEGKRVFFHVADEFVDRIQIRYHLSANAMQSHVFTIPQGGLEKLANLPQ